MKPDYVNSGVFDLQYRCLAFGGRGWRRLMEAENKTEEFKINEAYSAKAGYKHVNLFEITTTHRTTSVLTVSLRPSRQSAVISLCTQFPVFPLYGTATK